MDSIKFNLISNNVKGIQPNKKRLKILKYPKKKFILMEFRFCKEHIPRWKMRLDGMVILMDRYIIPMVNLIHAVFLLLFW